MEFDTFDQLFRFREHCLCGSKLQTVFEHSSFNDEYVAIMPRSSYCMENNNTIIRFPCNIESRCSPYGEVDFDFICYVSSPTFSIKSHYIHPHNGLSILSSD